MKLGNSEYNLFLCKKYMFMKTTSEYLQLLKQFKDTNAKKYGIQKIGLFGSVARGEHQEGSDVDVCFEGNAIGLFALARLKSELEALFGVSVDLLRMRKQLDGSVLKESVMRDIIYA
jgi:predicted nucleotidyltransferase